MCHSCIGRNRSGRAGENGARPVRALFARNVASRCVVSLLTLIHTVAVTLSLCRSFRFTLLTQLCIPRLLCLPRSHQLRISFLAGALHLGITLSLRITLCALLTLLICP